MPRGQSDVLFKFIGNDNKPQPISRGDVRLQKRVRERAEAASPRAMETIDPDYIGGQTKQIARQKIARK
jgi:hypothetical protein